MKITLKTKSHKMFVNLNQGEVFAWPSEHYEWKETVFIKILKDGLPFAVNLRSGVVIPIPDDTDVIEPSEAILTVNW